MARERVLKNVPIRIRWLVPLMLAIQIGFRAVEAPPVGAAVQLTAAPSVNNLRMAALGEPVGLAVALTLYLQAFDVQPGVSLAFRDLDYGRLISWLDAIDGLDPASSYPLLLASHVYSRVPDEEKQRAALQFVFDRFHDDPVHRWRWLAHASIVARHRLNDMPLALKYARAIATEANDPSVPSWARQMHIFLLEDLGEVEAAKILLGGLLASGAVTDPHEVHFLLERFKKLEGGEISTVLPKP